MNGEQPENPDSTRGFDPDPPDPDAGRADSSRDAREGPPHAACARPNDPLLARSLALVRFLREHCPWDAAQTPETLRPYLLEEAHETADAILGGEPGELAGELGDLLLNVAFQIVVAEEEGAFDAAEVVERLEEKMRARHPHVYGDAEEPPDWEELKARERAADHAGDELSPSGPDGAGSASTGERSFFAGLPESLEPLSRSLRLQERAAAVGFDWPEARGAARKLEEEIDEVRDLLPAAAPAGSGPSSAGGASARLEEEIGDLLFAAVNVARRAGVHPSTALARANRKFEARFDDVARRARRRGLDLAEASLGELESLWQEVKARGDPGGETAGEADD